MAEGDAAHVDFMAAGTVLAAACGNPINPL